MKDLLNEPCRFILKLLYLLLTYHRIFWVERGQQGSPRPTAGSTKDHPNANCLSAAAAGPCPPPSGANLSLVLPWPSPNIAPSCSLETRCCHTQRSPALCSAPYKELQPPWSLSQLLCSGLSKHRELSRSSYVFSYSCENYLQWIWFMY